MDDLKSLIFQPIKIKAPDDNILFWGCMHYGHDPKWENPIWKTRGFDSAEECGETLIQRWNAKANSETIGFLLGDTVFSDPDGKKFLGLMERLTFKQLYICAGNHYSGFKQALEGCHGNSLEIGIGNFITFCPNYFEAFINGQAVVMSHYPILSWNGQARSSFSLYSHVHGNLGKSAIGKAFEESGARALEVSVEKFPSPPNFTEIKDILKKRPPVSFDHHDSNTQNPF
jgi:calcineurin-like phosphoesterase family protein